MNVHERNHKPLPDLFSDLVGQVTSLFNSELRLARAEMSEKVSQVGNGLRLIVLGAALLIPALVILFQAGVAALVQHGFTEPIASLIVGGAALLIGLVTVLVGVNRLKVENLAPKRTMQALQRDAAMAKEQVT